jgi:hypothetical protein
MSMIRNNSQRVLPAGTARQPRATGDPGRHSVSDDDEIHGFQGFLVDQARRKQAAQQQAPARAGPRGGRQTLIFFDDQPPQVWETRGDLPGFEP